MIKIPLGYRTVSKVLLKIKIELFNDKIGQKPAYSHE